MLLSDEEIAAICAKETGFEIEGYQLTDYAILDFARGIEAEILAKLASAELPEPATVTVLKEIPYYTYDQLRQAYAQGAASQLAEKPSGYLSQYNLEMLQQGYPQTIVMLEGAKRDVPLYTRRQA